jgi:hypothetical protein
VLVSSKVSVPSKIHHSWLLRNLYLSRRGVVGYGLSFERYRGSVEQVDFAVFPSRNVWDAALFGLEFDFFAIYCLIVKIRRTCRFCDNFRRIGN